MSYGERLRKVRKKLGLTQNEFAKAIGLKNKQTISDIENGKQQRLSVKNELNFCEKYNIDISWLQMGKFDMSTSKTNDGDRVKEPYVDYGDSITLAYYPEVYTKVNKGSYLSLQNTKPISFSKKFIELHLGLANYKDMFIIDSVGESMEPTLKNGALLFVNPMKNEEEGVRDGSIYMMICDNSMLVKRVLHNPIDKIHTLISDNSTHDDITLATLEESGCDFVGRVVGSFNKI